MAVACDAHSKYNELLSVEGMDELMRCRAGLPAGSYASPDFPGMNMNKSANPGSAFEQGAQAAATANISKRADMARSVTKGWKPPVEQQAAQNNLAESTSLADPFTNPTGTSHDGVTDSSAWSDPLGEPQVSSGNSTPPAVAPSDSETQGEISAALDGGTANLIPPTPSPVAQVPNASTWDQFASQAPSTGAPSGAIPPGESLTSSSSFPSDPSFPAVIPDSTTNSSGPSGDTLFSFELDALTRVNDSFNENPSSRYVTDQGLKQAGGQFQQGLTVIDDASQTGVFSTNASAGNNAAAVQQFQFDFNGLGVASVEAVLPGYPYLDAVTHSARAWQKTIQNTMGSIKTDVESFYNHIAGPSDCTDPFTLNPDCTK